MTCVANHCTSWSRNARWFNSSAARSDATVARLCGVTHHGRRNRVGARRTSEGAQPGDDCDEPSKEPEYWDYADQCEDKQADKQ
jgi:hypothetical protein